MRRTLALMITALGFAGTLGALPATAGAVGIPPAKGGAAPPGVDDPAIAWNRFVLGLQATPGVQPATVHPTYELAIVHAALYDAVLDARHVAPAAAADAAAHETLTALYPAQRPAIDTEYATRLAQLPGGPRTGLGVRIGQHAARQLLAARADDGSGAAPDPFVPGGRPGDYQLTPPAFGAPVFTHWARVRPFVLSGADRFRPPAPAALTSAKYAAAINEVQRVGVATGSARTADQTQIGLFWNPPIWAAWNRIAETAAVGRHDGLVANARTFATLDLTFADAVIAFYDAKYAYRFWRPVTAIRAAATDGNPDTTADAAWTPLSNTAPDPSYPGAHGTISAAGADVLAALYGNDVAFTTTSAALPGVERTFDSFSEAAQEASASRIFNGNHTRLDEVAGENLGHNIAGFVLRHDRLPRVAAER
jgi:hypothetical protein